MSLTLTTIFGQIVHEVRSGVERFYLPDAIGNTVALVDTTGAVTDTWIYSPYGEVLSHGGSSTTSFTSFGTLGYFTDAANRLYVRARYYRPDLTRWLTVDPLWPQQGPFSYAKLKPAIVADPSGRQAGAVAAGVVILVDSGPFGWFVLGVAVVCVAAYAGACCVDKFIQSRPVALPQSPPWREEGPVDPPHTPLNGDDWDCGPRCDVYCHNEVFLMWRCIENCMADCWLSGGLFPLPPGSGSFGGGQFPWPNPWWGYFS